MKKGVLVGTPVGLVVGVVAELEVLVEESVAENCRATQGAGIGRAQGPRLAHTTARKYT